MSFCGFAQLVTIFIFLSAWDKSRVKWDNSRNSTQKMRTLRTKKKLIIYSLAKNCTFARMHAKDSKMINISCHVKIKGYVHKFLKIILYAWHLSSVLSTVRKKLITSYLTVLYDVYVHTAQITVCNLSQFPWYTFAV